MDEQTITDPILPGGTGADEPAQPDAQDQSAASQPSEPQQPNDAEETQTTEPSAQDENLAWLQKKGIDPTSPEAMSKLAEMYRNAEKQMHESTARASELSKTLAQDAKQPTQPEGGEEQEVVGQLVSEVQQLKQAQQISAFFGDAENGADRKAYEPKMAELVTNDPNLKALVNAGYVSIDQLFYMAKGADPGQAQKLKSEGGREALEQLAQKQQGKAVTGAATSSDLGDESGEDPFLAGMNKVN